MQSNRRKFIAPLLLCGFVMGLGCTQFLGDGSTGSGGTDEASTGGETSTGGDTAATTAPSGQFCVHECTSASDCQVDGVDIGLTCDGSRCVNASPCASDLECTAELSEWTIPCTPGGGECAEVMGACVGTVLVCAYPPNDVVTCESFEMEEVPVTDAAGDPITVCGVGNARCGDDGNCFVGCESNVDCTTDAAPVCNVATGLCECGADVDCQTLGSPAQSTCVQGQCGCASNEDCVAGQAGDLCQDGICACSGDAACANVSTSFDGGTIRCGPA